MGMSYAGYSIDTDYMFITSNANYQKRLRIIDMDDHTILHVLRNPSGHSNDAVRAARNEAANLIEDLKAKNKELEKKLKIAEIKNSGTLANNLCPDHRDKQYGRPCLACLIEISEKKSNELLDALRDALDLVQLTDKYYKDRIEYINGQALITKYRG